MSNVLHGTFGKAPEQLDPLLRKSLVYGPEPPPGDLPDPELLAAYCEDRLFPAEAAALEALIRRSPAARAELLELAPERHAALFQGEAEGEAEAAPQAPAAAPAQAPLRASRGLLAVLAIAACVAVVPLLFGAPAPAGGGVQFARTADEGRLRIAPTRDAHLVGPGERFQLLMDLGAPRRLDAWLGRDRWGALLRVDTAGRVSVLARTDAPPPECIVTPETMGCLVAAPERPGREHFALVLGTGGVPEAQLAELTREAAQAGPQGAAATLRTRLERQADRRRWAVHHLPPVQITDGR